VSWRCEGGDPGRHERAAGEELGCLQRVWRGRDGEGDEDGGSRAQLDKADGQKINTKTKRW
jgi:hypothetical protein